MRFKLQNLQLTDRPAQGLQMNRLYTAIYMYITESGCDRRTRSITICCRSVLPTPISPTSRFKGNNSLNLNLNSLLVKRQIDNPSPGNININNLFWREQKMRYIQSIIFQSSKKLINDRKLNKLKKQT